MGNNDTLVSMTILDDVLSFIMGQKEHEDVQSSQEKACRASLGSHVWGSHAGQCLQGHM